MIDAYVGLGSNQGDRCAYLQQAVAALRAHGAVVVSSLYETAPLLVTDQPDYMNAVVKIATMLDPYALLHLLQGIENTAHRTRSVRYGPRTLDCDLLLYAEWVLNTEELTLPHAALCDRAFVLQPLLEIAPEIMIPGKGSARSCLAALGAQRCCVYQHST